MKHILALLIAGLFISCKGEPDPVITDYSQKYHVESAQMTLDMMKTIQKGDTVSDEEWATLFDTPGYQAYTCSSMEFKRELVRDAITNVFDPGRQAIEDSILALPMATDINGLKQLLHRNFNSLEGQLPEVEQFLSKTDFPSLMQEGDSIARTFLPENLQDERPELFDTHFIFMEPDAYVQGCGMIVDANNAFNNGVEELIKLFSHEYHHVYYGLMVKGYSHPLLKQLEPLHKEGLADLVDKPLAPFKSIMGYPMAFVQFYNKEYSNTPGKLQQLDSLVNTAIAEEWPQDDLSNAMQGYFAFGGHPNGYYMAHLIREKSGLEAAINTFSDIVQFFEEYNAAAEKDSEAYVLSDTFMGYLKGIRDAELEAYSNYSDTPHQVTFNVTVPNSDDEVFITGDQENLGEWNPANIKLDRVSEKERSITLLIKAPADFKFTRGSWKTEGYIKDKAIGPNLRLGFDRDTTVTYTVEAWADAQK